MGQVRNPVQAIEKEFSKFERIITNLEKAFEGCSAVITGEADAIQKAEEKFNTERDRRRGVIDSTLESQEKAITFATNLKSLLESKKPKDK